MANLVQNGKFIDITGTRSYGTINDTSVTNWIFNEAFIADKYTYNTPWKIPKYTSDSSANICIFKKESFIIQDITFDNYGNYTLMFDWTKRRNDPTIPLKIILLPSSISPIETTGITPISTTGITPISTTGITPISTTGITPISSTGISPINNIPPISPINTGNISPSDQLIWSQYSLIFTISSVGTYSLYINSVGDDDDAYTAITNISITQYSVTPMPTNSTLTPIPTTQIPTTQMPTTQMPTTQMPAIIIPTPDANYLSAIDYLYNYYNNILIPKSSSIENVLQVENRRNSFDDTYRKRYNEYIKIICIVIFAVVSIWLCILIDRQDVLPEGFFNIIVIITVSICIISIYITYQNILKQNLLIYDEIDIEAPAKIAPSTATPTPTNSNNPKTKCTACPEKYFYDESSKSCKNMFFPF
jgi:hypothetical protein